MSLGVGNAKARVAANTNAPATTDFNKRDNMKKTFQSRLISSVAVHCAATVSSITSLVDQSMSNTFK
jgi:hypothetical protein